MHGATRLSDGVAKLVPGGDGSLAHLSDRELLANTRGLVGKSHQLFAALLAHLAEVEARGLHRTRACASLYTYCIYELRFSEDAAARRAGAAKLALANELGLDLATVRLDAVVSSYLGETAANLRKVFDFVEAHRLVVLFDEFDALGKEREDRGEHGELRRVINAFLQMLDAYRGPSLLIAATNHQGLLDRALWRRFDDVLLFDRPTPPQIRSLVQGKLRAVRADLPLDRPNFLERFAGMAHADIERVLVRAIKNMVLGGRQFVTEDLLDRAQEREAARRGVTKK